MQQQPLLTYLQEHHEAMIEDLRTVVTLESPTTEKAAVDRLGQHLAAKFQELGCTLEVVPQPAHGDQYVLTYAPAGTPATQPVLVLGHMDTVFDLGDIAKNPLRLENGRLYGPGTSDMKGGVIQCLWALRALNATGAIPSRPVRIVLTSDEEMGSHASRALIEAQAREAVAALIIEPAMHPGGQLKTWRKGTGHFTLEVTGKAAHAGADPTKGISAIQELSHQIQRLHAMTDMAVGTTVNVGVIKGGTRGNVVAEFATAEIDVRVMNQAEAERLDAAIRGLTPVLPGAVLKVTGGLNRPPLERHMTMGLYERAAALAAELGFTPGEAGTGGGSDGNFTAAVGCPTLDGLGIVGNLMHTHNEYVEVAEMPCRAALLARLLQTL